MEGREGDSAFRKERGRERVNESERELEKERVRESEKKIGRPLFIWMSFLVELN